MVVQAEENRHKDPFRQVLFLNVDIETVVGLDVVGAGLTYRVPDHQLEEHGAPAYIVEFSLEVQTLEGRPSPFDHLHKSLAFAGRGLPRKRLFDHPSDSDPAVIGSFEGGDIHRQTEARKANEEAREQVKKRTHKTS